MKGRKINLVSYPTWKRKNNPTVFEGTDGVFGYILSINPTLANNGFRVCCEESDYNLLDERKPKQIALENLRSLFRGENEHKLYEGEFVYSTYVGSRISCKQDTLTVWIKDE